MSHKATNWAFEIRNIRPSTKLVLLALADCHNPRQGCFPSQEYLAEVTGMSERSVRDQIGVLESLSLIRKIRVNSGLGRVNNRYIFGFEDSTLHPEAKFAGGLSQRQNGTLPEAEHDISQRQNLPGNLVREHGKEPASSEFAKKFDEFWHIFPRKNKRDDCFNTFMEVCSNGVDPFYILNSAKLYAEHVKDFDQSEQKFITSSLKWLDESRWQDFNPPAQERYDIALIEKMLNSKVPIVREQAQKMKAEYEKSMRKGKE